VTAPGVKEKLSIFTSAPGPAAEAATAILEPLPGCKAEDAPLSVITNTVARSAKALHLKSTNLLALILFIV
jgi:hypothetical protein